jgi:autotransporter-associated beta strand protein
LIKLGAGTLSLSNTGNNYTGGTYVEAGTLNVGATGSVLPANRDITVFNGATLNIGSSNVDNFGSPVGTITLDGGLFRVSGNNVSYSLNGLQTGITGGTIDFSGSNSTLYLTGTSPAIVINGNSQFTCPGAPPIIFNPIDSRITVAVAPNKTLTSSVAIGSICQILGGGTVYVTAQPNSYAVNYVVTQGRLRVDDMSVTAFQTVLGDALPGLVTLDGGILQYSGPTATSPMPISTSSFGGTLEISNPTTTLTYTGDFSGLGPLIKSGPGVLILSNTANSYASGLIVSGGRLDVSDDAQLGIANPTVNPAGTLRYTSSASTARTFNLAGGTLEAPAGVTLALNGATVNGGFLRGGGTYTLSGNTAIYGSTTLNSTTMIQTGPASVTNFTNGGLLTVGAGQPLTWYGGLNQSTGTVTVAGSAHVSDFGNNGVLNVPAGGLISNTGSNLIFGGGSTSFVGSVANPGGKIDLGGQQLVVRGGLLVTNSGSFGSGNGVRNGTTVADYGALVKGTGPYQAVITQNGGQYLPGNSPGTSQVGTLFVNGGGNLIFEITDAGPSASFPSAPGTAGTNPGWGLTQVFTSLEFTATPSNKFTIDMRTQLPPPAAPNSPGQMSSFDPSRAYSWLIFDLQPGAVFNGTFNPAAINFITTQFANSTSGGQFSLSRTGGQIFLTFTPVPEPAVILGVAFVGLFGWRELTRRRRPETQTV